MLLKVVVGCESWCLGEAQGEVRPPWFFLGTLMIADVFSHICCTSPIVGQFGEIILRMMYAFFLRNSLLDVSVMYKI